MSEQTAPGIGNTSRLRGMWRLNKSKGYTIICSCGEAAAPEIASKINKLKKTEKNDNNTTGCLSMPHRTIFIIGHPRELSLPDLYYKHN